MCQMLGGSPDLVKASQKAGGVGRGAVGAEGACARPDIHAWRRCPFSALRVVTLRGDLEATLAVDTLWSHTEGIFYLTLRSPSNCLVFTEQKSDIIRFKPHS